ncbi:helix-turn-helix domain-containing protein [Stratiformator vulcanicus]|uniref:Helix-turn-helix domain protein n=1 Tax=Stratiformator vulcanicus TaxID=2527980 RepID=A0A517QYX9_9PLAN|nr:Helix-turn-helix domain protein [Stratiformator vulcanicus]
MDDIDQTPELLTVAETAWQLRICDKTLRRWIKKGRIFAVQPAGPGGRILIPRSELDAVASRQHGAHRTNIEQTPRSTSGPRPRWKRLGR